jgi:hypothetical protein
MYGWGRAGEEEGGGGDMSHMSMLLFLRSNVLRSKRRVGACREVGMHMMILLAYVML